LTTGGGGRLSAFKWGLLDLPGYRTNGGVINKIGFDQVSNDLCPGDVAYMQNYNYEQIVAAWQEKDGGLPKNGSYAWNGEWLICVAPGQYAGLDVTARNLDGPGGVREAMVEGYNGNLGPVMGKKIGGQVIVPLKAERDKKLLIFKSWLQPSVGALQG
jgi:hypothetical protein